jgi:hypothetical protein
METKMKLAPTCHCFNCLHLMSWRLSGVGIWAQLGLADRQPITAISVLFAKSCIKFYSSEVIIRSNPYFASKLN